MNTYRKLLIDSVIGDEDNVEIVMNVAAGVVMRYDESNRKQILMIQRAQDDHWPGHWEFPRGKCDKPIGESLLHCAWREIKEETGLDVEPLVLIDTFEYMADQGKRKSICHNFLCRMENPGQPVKLSKEHQDYKWVSELGEIELIALPDQKRTLEKVLNTDRTMISNPQNTFTKNNQQVEGYLQWLYQMHRKD
ncbi:MAG: NUDIX domain-containing protein [Vallitaleaceae bacterium]|nr:NUDIX domain-containing protein [Vallitaleaceae bacterium]